MVGNLMRDWLLCKCRKPPIVSTYTARRSIAELAGLRLGDVIVQVNSVVRDVTNQFVSVGLFRLLTVPFACAVYYVTIDIQDQGSVRG